MNNNRLRSNAQISALTIGFLGVQIGFALQAGNATRILQNYGANLSEISLFWLIAPLSGALIQPIIGYISDLRIKKGNTRIPYMIFGGICSALALFALPNAHIFITFISPLIFGAVIILIIDSAFNISMHPLRATITDYLSDQQQPKGFAIQTFLISIGAVIGSTLPYFLDKVLHLKTTSELNQIPQNVKWSLYIGGILLLTSLLINTFTIKKLQLSELTRKLDTNRKENIKESLKNISPKMWKIGIIQFFSWSAFFLIWVFMTPAIAQKFYNEYNHLATSKNYAEAANLTGVLFGMYHVSATIFSLSLPYLYKKINVIYTHAIGLFIGFTGLLIIFYSSDIKQLYLPMMLLGVAWASILSTPYAILSRHINKQTVGFNLGVFNLFITAPQIVNGLLGGFVIQEIFNGEAFYAILLAAFSLLLASVFCFLFFKKLQ